MKDRKTAILIWVLIVIILILIGVMVYAFAIRPAVSGYLARQQTIGYQYGQVDLLNSILLQIQQTGLVQIPAGANQSVILRPLTQQELAQLQQMQQQTSAQ